MRRALLPRRRRGMFPLMVRPIRRLPLFAAIALFGASYSPDIGLLLGAGVSHTRYGFRGLPPSTRLLAEAAYATRASTYRIDVAGEFRRPLLPAILYIELRASGLE